MICSPVMSKEPLEQNAILRDLKSEDRVRVLADGSIRRFELREIVYEAQQHIEDAYFPLGCVLSFVTLMQDGAMIEIGTIGHEGTTGIQLIIGGDRTENRAFCQVNGNAWKMSAQTFRQMLEESELPQSRESFFTSLRQHARAIHGLQPSAQRL
jgi:CRP-like cAMP-binding protein